MMPVKAPRSTEDATALLERYAAITDQLSTIEAERNRLIADANAAADKEADPLLTERGEIHEKLQAWWGKAAAKLTYGTRKSIELGGCLIGTRMGPASLAIAGDEKLLVAAMKKRKWALPLLRFTVGLDKTAIRKALTGQHGRKLKTLGFNEKPGDELFVLDRAEQEGTLAGAGQ